MQIAVRGGRRAEGEVVLQGSKNAALPMLAASILTSDEMIFRHCPDISDVRVMAELWKILVCRRHGKIRFSACRQMC